MSAASRTQNALVARIIRELSVAAETTADLNVMAESLLLGVGMLNYPADARKQALVIQEIADAAQDRVEAVRR